MASSTTMPMANTKPNSVRVLMVNPSGMKKMNVPTDAKKEEFFKDYQSKYSFEEDGFEETKALYTTLVSGL